MVFLHFMIAMITCKVVHSLQVNGIQSNEASATPLPVKCNCVNVIMLEFYLYKYSNYHFDHFICYTIFFMYLFNLYYFIYTKNLISSMFYFNNFLTKVGWTPCIFLFKDVSFKYTHTVINHTLVLLRHCCWNPSVLKLNCQDYDLNSRISG